MEQAIKAAAKLFLLLTFLGVLLFAVGASRNDSLAHIFLLWNLLLAWIPLLLSWWLVRILGSQSWSGWPAIGLTIAWIAFLPNSFYMITDFIHLQDVSRVDPTYDALMFSVIVMTGVLLGFASLVIVHMQLIRRLASKASWRVIVGILLLTSFAIYIGRELRWNTWDIVANPAGILFDLSERVLNPFAHPQTFVTTFSFFVVLVTVYYAIWRGISWYNTVHETRA